MRRRVLLYVLAAMVPILWWIYAYAGPLSSEQVMGLMMGIPTDHQIVVCSTAQATASTAIPKGSLVRIAIEGSVGINMKFADAGATIAVNGGPYIPPGAIDLFQNDDKQYFFCIMRSGSATVSLAVMK